ncbi:hypothetical protein ACFXI0_07850 [Kitasatospora indigofera]|uniref:hypothetical protein n=1 Tax=Kitasatospora indigofera TaxID=67307 RepID=UPI0036BCDCD8
MPTLHQYPNLCRPADVYRDTDPERATRAEVNANTHAWNALAAGCRAVAELRTIPVLFVSDRRDSPLGHWAPATWEQRPVWLRIMFAQCQEARCHHLTPQAQHAARQAAHAAASPRLRTLRRAAARRKAGRTRWASVVVGGVLVGHSGRVAVATLSRATEAVRELSPDRFAPHT